MAKRPAFPNERVDPGGRHELKVGAMADESSLVPRLVRHQIAIVAVATQLEHPKLAEPSDAISRIPQVAQHLVRMLTELRGGQA